MPTECWLLEITATVTGHKLFCAGMYQCVGKALFSLSTLQTSIFLFNPLWRVSSKSSVFGGVCGKLNQFVLGLCLLKNVWTYSVAVTLFFKIRYKSIQTMYH